MKVFVLSFVLLSICYGLNARCISGPDSSDDCPLRIFTQPEPRQIRYIYTPSSSCQHEGPCDCPKYHDTIVQKPQMEEQPVIAAVSYEYKINKPEEKVEAEQEVGRYLFDVRVEKPVQTSPERPSASYNYQLQEAQVPQALNQQSNSIRYLFDTRVEQPIKPCDEKPWQGLVTQIDAVMMPKPCSNPNHTPGNCNCGCQNPSHTPSTCDCMRDLFNLPMTLSPVQTSHKRIKRDTKNKNKKLSLQLSKSDIKLPKLKPLKNMRINSKSFKKIEPKELASAFKAEQIRPAKQKTLSTLKPNKLSQKQQFRLKRKQKSPCGYEFESCDLKRKTPAGCPLCYKCHCEPADDSENQRFSPKDIRIPYQIVSHDQAFSPAAQQEFDDEPSSYTGLRKPDMYKQYIEQVISKYPEHMSRKLPNVMDQQRDLMDFINDLARNDKSPQSGKTEDVRYQIVDDALELYKIYENAVSSKPAPFGNRRLFNKRGTVLEVIEVDPEDLENGKIKLPDNDDNF